MPRPAATAIVVAALAALALLAAPIGAQAAKKKTRKTAIHSDSAPDSVIYGRREDVMRFGAELAERRGLDPAWVQAALSEARYIPSVARFIMPPPTGTAKNWAAYRARFI
ncbi:MAG: lytic murein transglycosylase B, partial [Caldimonas sp.]